MLSRPHPRFGWMHVDPVIWRQTVQRSVDERDKLGDPTQSGAAPEFCRWCREEQLPALLRQERYAKQAREHCTRLERKLQELNDQIARGRLDLEPAAGQVRAELRWLQSLLEVPA